MNKLKISKILKNRFDKIISFSKIFTLLFLLFLISELKAQIPYSDEQSLSFYILGDDFNESAEENLVLRISMIALSTYTNGEYLNIDDSISLNAKPDLHFLYHACILTQTVDSNGDIKSIDERINCFDKPEDLEISNYYHIDRKRNPLDKVPLINNTDLAYKKVKLGLIGSTEAKSSDFDQFISDNEDSVNNNISSQHKIEELKRISYLTSAGFMSYLTYQFGRMALYNIISSGISGGGGLIFGGVANAVIGTGVILTISSGAVVIAGVVLAGASIYRTFNLRRNFNIDQTIVLETTQKIIDLTSPPSYGELAIIPNSNTSSSEEKTISSEFSAFETIKSYRNFFNSIN